MFKKLILSSFLISTVSVSYGALNADDENTKAKSMVPLSPADYSLIRTMDKKSGTTYSANYYPDPALGKPVTGEALEALSPSSYKIVRNLDDKLKTDYSDSYYPNPTAATPAHSVIAKAPSSPEQEKNISYLLTLTAPQPVLVPSSGPLPLEQPNYDQLRNIDARMQTQATKNYYPVAPQPKPQHNVCTIS